MTEATRDKGFSPVLSFGVGQAIVATSVAVGNLLGKIAYAAMPGNIIDALAIISALSLLLLIFLLTFLFEWKESHKTDSEAPPFSNHGENTPSKELDAEWGEVEHAFAKSLKLTARETEVIGYLLKGRSIPYAAQAMFVTAGTVKTHVAHIYQKAGVNSRQQLLDLYEQYIHPKASL
jgi:DNA-binding CsgD family transcriptional regulator